MAKLRETFLSAEQDKLIGPKGQNCMKVPSKETWLSWNKLCLHVATNKINMKSKVHFWLCTFQPGNILPFLQNVLIRKFCQEGCCYCNESTTSEGSHRNPGVQICIGSRFVFRKFQVNIHKILSPGFEWPPAQRPADQKHVPRLFSANFGINL